MPNRDHSQVAIKTIRFLAADAVQQANSGHPGLPMGAASLAYVLWTQHLRFDPQAPDWANRDRFVLSAGHGSMLLYALLHLTGYDLPLGELQRFRQWGSHTPGHPEFGDTPGVETTTGPLGQGFATGVGMAIAADHKAAVFNRKGFPILDHYIFALVSDGDLMEGVASEAASLAGHLQLSRLVYLYDDNSITIDGSTELSFTEDRAARFEAYGWHVQRVEDSNDLEAVDEALAAAKGDPRPSLIACRTQIGYGLPTKQNTAAAHGEPPGEGELAAAKEQLGWPPEPRFLIPAEAMPPFRDAAERGRAAHAAWRELLLEYADAHPDLARRWERCERGGLPYQLENRLAPFPHDPKGLATRASSGKVINLLAPDLPELFGGSADLTGSNKTQIEGEAPFSVKNRRGRYLHYGVREHAMGSIMTGLALHGGLIPYGGTFLVFSDYMRPAIRLAAMMRQRVIYVFTHDSIGLGEDGPTHQPIEQLAALRAIPNLIVIRPADANEVAQAWMVALAREEGPTALALTRQALPTLNREILAPAEGLRRGAYVLADFGEGDMDALLMASGSEVPIVLEAASQLYQEGLKVRALSFPSWELFSAQSETYRNEILPEQTRVRIAVEAGVSQGWHRWVGSHGVVLGLDHFGASAPYLELYQHFGLTVENVIETTLRTVDALS